MITMRREEEIMVLPLALRVPAVTRPLIYRFWRPLSPAVDRHAASALIAAGRRRSASRRATRRKRADCGRCAMPRCASRPSDNNRDALVAALMTGSRGLGGTQIARIAGKFSFALDHDQQIGPGCAAGQSQRQVARWLAGMGNETTPRLISST